MRDQGNFIMKNTWKIIVAIALFASFGINPAKAAVAEVISDGNSAASIDPESSAGMFSWTVDGQEYLAQQWFWYRLASDTQEYPVNSLNYLGATLNDTNPFDDPADDQIVLDYDDGTGAVTVSLDYTLTGGAAGSGAASIAELIDITNNTTETIEITIFQYSDFNLSASDSVVISGGNTATQTGGGAVISESVVTPAADDVEAALLTATLDKLNDSDIDNLDGSTAAGPGDVSWAFQWNVTLNPAGQQGSSFLISKIKNIQTIIPEPTSFALLGLGGLFLARRRRA